MSNHPLGCKLKLFTNTYLKRLSCLYTVTAKIILTNLSQIVLPRNTENDTLQKVYDYNE